MADQLNPNNTHTPTELTPQNTEFPSTWLVLIIFVLFLAMCAFFKLMNDARENRAESTWAELQAQSPAHAVLGDAYLDCMSARSGTMAKCVVITKQYAEIVGLEGEATAVIQDIMAANRKLESGH